jgi:hypothetical protein
MSYSYSFRGQNSVIWIPLLTETAIAAYIGAGTAEEYVLDAGTPTVDRPYRVNVNRPLYQKFQFLVKEVAVTSNLARTAIGTGTLQFGIFLMTKDYDTGLDRPCKFEPLATFIGTMPSSVAMTTTLTINHFMEIDGPIGTEGGVNNDYDPVDGVFFTAAAEGLMTGIRFGWRRAGSTGTNTMSGTVTFTGVDLLIS